MQRKDYTEANRQAWNQAAPVHAQHTFEGLLKAVQQPGFNCLDSISLEILNTIGVKDKTVAHVCCNNGRELLSVKNMGALRCVGFDISDAFIEQARRFAAGNFDCEFVQSDVYAIPATYDAQFDLVLITIGALSWMPDLQPFFAVIARLLKPDGHLFMYEEHPMLYMFETSETDDPPRIRNSYFRTEPFVDTSGIDYIGNTTYESSPQYNFHHKMSDIIEGCLQNGLTLISFREYEHDISTIFAHFEKFKYKPAMCYTLVAKRTDA